MSETRQFKKNKVVKEELPTKEDQVSSIVNGILKHGVLENKEQEFDGEKEYVLNHGVNLEQTDFRFLADNMRVREVKTKSSNALKIKSVKALIAFVTLINQGKYLELTSWGKVKEYLFDHADVLIYMMGNIPTLLEGRRLKHDAFLEFKDKYGKTVSSVSTDPDADQ